MTLPTFTMREAKAPAAGIATAGADARVGRRHASRSGKGSAALVIGSGFGGLAAAIRLAAAGHRVTVLERLDQFGGRARVHRQDGFVFDAGPTIVTAPFLFEDLWRLAGRRLEDDVDLRPLDPFYRVRFDDGESLDFHADDERMYEEIRRFDARDADGYRRLLEFAERMYAVGFDQLAHRPFDRATDMLRVLPDLLRLQGYRSVYSLVSRYIRTPRLRAAFSFHPLLIGGNPFATTAVYLLIAHLERRFGVHYAMGGTGALVAAMVRLLESMGGELRTNAEVDRICVTGGRAVGVQLVDGRTLAADMVVSNADPAWTYGHLLRDLPRRHWSERKLRRSRSSMGLFVWYFGTDRHYPGVPHHSILFGPRYRGLLDDIFRHRRLAEDMSIYLHRPTATDPAVAPAGCDAFYALSPVPNLEGETDWLAGAEAYRSRIEQRLAATVLPGLGDHVVSSRTATPLAFRDELLSWRGAGFAHEPTLTQSAWFRPHNRSEDFAGLYLVGAGTHPGAGLPGVLSSARVLEEVLNDV